MTGWNQYPPRRVCCVPQGFASMAWVEVGGAGTLRCRPQSLLFCGEIKPVSVGLHCEGSIKDQGTHSAEQTRSPERS